MREGNSGPARPISAFRGENFLYEVMRVACPSQENGTQMPYKTKSGTHYHESYGCCGAIESCGTEGLEPCRICCGKGDGNGGG